MLFFPSCAPSRVCATKCGSAVRRWGAVAMVTAPGCVSHQRGICSSGGSSMEQGSVAAP